MVFVAGAPNVDIAAAAAAGRIDWEEAPAPGGGGGRQLGEVGLCNMP